MTTTDPIAHYVEEGPSGARLRESGVELWALIAQLPTVGGDASALAAAYGLSREAVEASLDYYHCHKDLIDAQIALNAA